MKQILRQHAENTRQRYLAPSDFRIEAAKSGINRKVE